MCGVCGVVAFGRTLSEAEARTRIDPMLAALYHRGPEEAGHRLTGGAVLGCTRLAIRGLTSGTQPLVDPESGVVVVCNGEIDNHRELRAWLKGRGRTVDQAADVAVLPGLYLELGEDFVSRLSGMFGLAVWDPRTQRLLLARDRAGERSLFFTVRNGGVVVASELAAIAAEGSTPLEPDMAGLRQYLQYGIFRSPATPLRGVERLGPAELVSITAEGVQRRRYWQWSPARTAKAVPSAEDFDAVFRGAVGRQIDVDVDYGIFLSGGLDSSLVLSVAQQVRHRSRMKAYTLRFDEASFDESEYARRIAAAHDAESVCVRVGPDDIPTGIESLVRNVGEPLADPAWVPTALLARRAAQDVKMVLVGEGADELFGGYPTYLGALWGARYARLPGPLRVACEAAIRAWPVSDRKVAISYLLKRFIDGSSDSGLTRHLTWISTIPPATLQRLGVLSEFASPAQADADALLDCVQRHDLETSLAEGLLTKADRASMNASLELRAPFLDVRVLEYAATLPADQRVKGFSTKVFLKRYATRHLPRDLVYRRKRGLSVPLAQWLRKPLYAWARGRLEGGGLAAAGVDPVVALTLLDEHCQRRVDHARPLWTLIVLSEWFLWLQRQVKARGTA